jgi:hypothetical protein
MPGIALVRHVSAPLPARAHVRAETPRAEPEQVEEVWDAELVSDLPPSGWLAGSACATYQRAGYAMPRPLVDLRA